MWFSLPGHLILPTPPSPHVAAFSLTTAVTARHVPLAWPAGSRGPNAPWGGPATAPRAARPRGALERSIAAGGHRGPRGSARRRLVCRACGPMKKAPSANQRAAQADDPLALLHHHLLTARLRKTCQDEIDSAAFLDPFFLEYARLTVHPQPNSCREQVLCLGRG